MRRILTMLFVSVFMLSLCPLHAQETETLVLIDTDMGKIKVKLFNDTPLHRDNFIKNVKEHRYDGLLFHRVIKQFMIQGGDINSKDAPLDAHLGDGDLDYTIPAEFCISHQKLAWCGISGECSVPHVPRMRRIPRRPHQRLNSIS